MVVDIDHLSFLSSSTIHRGFTLAISKVVEYFLPDLLSHAITPSDL